MSSSSHVRIPAFRLLTIGAGLLGLMLLSDCSQGPPNPANAPEAKPQATELSFDERYLDSLSLGPPYSARTLREQAIDRQLRRLEMAKRSAYDPAQQTDSVWDSPTGGPLVGYPSRTAQLADIQRRLDSLKVLEHIPITSH